MFFSKIVLLLVAFSALFLQGCTTTRTRSSVSSDNGFWAKPNVFCSGGCKSNQAAALYWDEFSKEYKVLRSRGERLSPEGRILTPVPGKPGQFQDENGYRIIHQMSCNKENVAVTFFGALLSIGGSQLSNPLARVGTVGLTGATQTSLGRARGYKCAELAEELNAGNMVFQQRLKEEAALEATAEEEYPQQQQEQSMQNRPVQRSLAQAAPAAQVTSRTSVEKCESVWQACPAGGKWGPVLNDTQCGCR